MTLLQKIADNQLTGRGGACFPVAKKWLLVESGLSAKIQNSNEKVILYLVANGSEGEPGVKKDFYLLDKYPESVISGIKETMSYFRGRFGRNIDVRSIVYLNHDYFTRFRRQLQKLIEADNIKLFQKPNEAGYIGGEETALLNVLEGRRAEPRLKPPFPAESGLWGMPTLVQNIETFYHISRIASDQYLKTRFYTVGGDCFAPGVYEFSEDITINEVLSKTGNHPLKMPFEKSRYDFFVQVGGDASGEVFDSTQLNQPVAGAGSITVYSKAKHRSSDLIAKWVEFFKNESCGQCTPCREGSVRVAELLKVEKPNWKIINEIFDVMSETSFCALGASIPVAVRSYLANVHNNDVVSDD